MKFRGPKAHSNRLRNPETPALRGFNFVAADFGISSLSEMGGP